MTDHFQDGEGNYLVMELVEGADLGEVLSGRGYPGCSWTGGPVREPGL